MKNDRVEIEGIDANTYAGKAVQACKLKARGIFGDELLTFKLLDFVNFFILTNEFSSKGFIITDDNREEMYIKIIEQGDIKLIEDLEKYITLRDSLKLLQNKRQEFDDIVQKLLLLKDYNDKDQVNSIIEPYLRR